MDIKSFWDRVKILIKAHKISQSKFAEYLGLPFGTLKGWINKNRIPDLATALDIATALGVTVQYLAWGKENDTTEEEKQLRTDVKQAAGRIVKLNQEIQNDMDKINNYF